MNIFEVLSQGKSRLHEPSMSAMLAYLLNPNQGHGLGNRVIKNFLKLANGKFLYNDFINNSSLKYEIDLEVIYNHNNTTNQIDIQIKILDSSYAELHRIIIENKIKSGAANSNQLNNYYHAVLNDKDNDDSFELNANNLSVIFLTPKLKHKGLREEFSNLEIDNKTWLYWNSEDENNLTIVNLIQNILKLEQEAKISPINEYMRHTLKAFTHYIIKTIDISTGKYRFGEDIGELKTSKELIINSHKYTILLRDSGQIQLFNEYGDKITARPLLKEYLKTINVEEKYINANTRIIGKQIIDYLEGID